MTIQQNQQPTKKSSPILKKPVGYVHVYESEGGETPPSSGQPTQFNPLLILGLCGGALLMLAGVGSTAFSTYQKDRNFEAEVQARVDAALTKQQEEVADCINKVFDKQSKRK